MDELDSKIIGMLREDASIAIPKIARILKCPQPTIYARLNRLKRNGTIKKFTIITNDDNADLKTALIESKDYLISKMTPRSSKKLFDQLTGLPEIKMVVRIDDTKLLIAWVGEINLSRISGIEKITKTENLILRL
jgi:DNA-binding Lrp family transcriptional regulator